MIQCVGVLAHEYLSSSNYLLYAVVICLACLWMCVYHAFSSCVSLCDMTQIICVFKEIKDLERTLGSKLARFCGFVKVKRKKKKSLQLWWLFLDHQPLCAVWMQALSLNCVLIMWSAGLHSNEQTWVTVSRKDMLRGRDLPNMTLFISLWVWQQTTIIFLKMLSTHMVLNPMIF